MAREILFRAKIKNWREQPKDQWWVEGYYCKRKSGRYTDIGFEEEYKDCIIKELSDGGITLCDVDPETVCQYTGLEDRNGRKIFEGDVIAFVDMISTENGHSEMDCVGRVVWDEEEVCFHVTERLSAESWEVLQECCVVGNIFDNPELTEED